MRDPASIRYVTANYSLLRGLRVLPLGLAMALISLVDLLWLASLDGSPTMTDALVRMAVGLGVLAATYPLMVLIGRSYERTFGHVSQPAHRRRRESLMMALGGAGAFVVVLIDAIVRPSVLVLGLFIAFGLLLQHQRMLAPWRRPDILALAGLVALVSMAPLAGLELSRPAEGLHRVATGCLLAGVTIMALGFLDHRFLVRTLRPRQEAIDDRSV